MKRPRDSDCGKVGQLWFFTSSKAPAYRSGGFPLCIHRGGEVELRRGFSSKVKPDQVVLIIGVNDALNGGRGGVKVMCESGVGWILNHYLMTEFTLLDDAG